MRSTGSFHCPLAGARNNRIVGYHGLSDRSNIQRKSGSLGISVQIGRPSAPARWAMLVSTEIVRSRFESTADVSAKSFSSSPSRTRLIPGGAVSLAYALFAVHKT